MSMLKLVIRCDQFISAIILFSSFLGLSSLLLSTSFSILSVAIHKPWSPVESVSKPEALKNCLNAPLATTTCHHTSYPIGNFDLWYLINLTTKFRNKRNTNVMSLGHDRSQSICHICQRQVPVSSRPAKIHLHAHRLSHVISISCL